LDFIFYKKEAIKVDYLMQKGNRQITAQSKEQKEVLIGKGYTEVKPAVKPKNDTKKDDTKKDTNGGDKIE
jgi:hypothetical protein